MIGSSLIREDKLAGRMDGYPSTIAPQLASAYDSIVSAYAESQLTDNIAKTDRYLLPLARRVDACNALDAGCGVGATVERLREHGVDAYGFDLVENVKFWREQKRPPDRFVVAAPIDPLLPFADGTFDLVYSFGVIEHVGTTNGHSNRRRDYHEIRRRWTLELFRVVRQGGYLFLAGPNRRFPIDTAHGPDSAAMKWEKAFATRFGVTIHRPWGENFLWGYSDVQRYLADREVVIEPLSIEDLMNFSRVPKPLRAVSHAYVRFLPKSMLGTGFNPWVAALVKKTAMR
jgi:SAM-dependent methyltransferase